MERRYENRLGQANKERKTISPRQYVETEGLGLDERGTEYFEDLVSAIYMDDLKEAPSFKDEENNEDSSEPLPPEDMSDEDIERARKGAAEYVWLERGGSLPEPKDPCVSPFSRFYYGESGSGGE